MKQLEILLPDGTHVCTAQHANNLLTRGWGLLGRRGLADNAGLLIEPCTSVHTWFMRFTIDVLYLDSMNTIVKAVTLSPWRMSLGGRGAKRVLELPAGAIGRYGLAPGLRLELRPYEAAGDPRERQQKALPL